MPRLFFANFQTIPMGWMMGGGGMMGLGMGWWTGPGFAGGGFFPLPLVARHKIEGNQKAAKRRYK